MRFSLKRDQKREDPADRGENSIEQIIKREYERWLEPVPPEESIEPFESDGDEEEPESDTV